MLTQLFKLDVKSFFTTIALIFAPHCLQADDTWPPLVDQFNHPEFSEEGITRLDNAMANIVEDRDVSGMVWLLVKNGEVATFGSSGLARSDDQQPMELDTLFRIYSMTKPVTGVALMMLWERGLWDFDDPVSLHVPALAGLKIIKENDDGQMILVSPQREPTMRELLNHSAGYGYGLSGKDPVNQQFRDSQVLASANLDELISKVSEIPLLFEPGERYYYSVAVDIQGYIVQQLSGQRFGAFLREELFGPLGMTDTRFFVRPEDVTRFAEVHQWDAEQHALVQREHRQDRPSYLDSDRLESGGGGLVSSTHDYARFLQMLVNEGELDGERILSPEAVRIMRTNSLRDGLNLRGSLTSEGSIGQGFGVDFAVIMNPAKANLPHSPGTYYWSGAAGTWFWIDPQEDMFWIGMIQARGKRRPGAADMRRVAADIIYDSILP